MFAWNVPLISLVFLKRSLVFPVLLFSSMSLHWSLKKAFHLFTSSGSHDQLEISATISQDLLVCTHVYTRLLRFFWSVDTVLKLRWTLPQNGFAWLRMQEMVWPGIFSLCTLTPWAQPSPEPGAQSQTQVLCSFPTVRCCDYAFRDKPCTHCGLDLWATETGAVPL